MNTVLKRLSMLALAVPLVAAATPAQELGFGLHTQLGKHGYGSIQVGYGSHSKAGLYGGRVSSIGHGRSYGSPRRSVTIVAPRRAWVPSAWVTVHKQVWVPGTVQKVWVPAVYETRYDACGKAYQVLVCAGHWEHVTSPGHYETHPVQVWQAGHWKDC